MIFTGYTAAMVRAHGMEVDADVPDCAEAWANEMPEIEVKGGGETMAEAFTIVCHFPRGVEWRWLTVDMTIKDGANGSQT